MSEETEEEFEARLRAISDEVKADMDAGRYRHGQLHPEIHAKEQTYELVPWDVPSTTYKYEERTSSVSARDAWKEELIRKMLDLDREHSEHMRRSLMMPADRYYTISGLQMPSKEYHSTKEIKAREKLLWKRGDFYDID